MAEDRGQRTEDRPAVVVEAPRTPAPLVAALSTAPATWKAPPDLHPPPSAWPGCPNLTAAVAAAREKCRAVEKSATNAFHNYKYAPADGVIAEAREALTGTGLALIPLRHTLSVLGSGTAAVHTVTRQFILAHTSGESAPIDLTWPVIPDRGRPLDKALAAALTESLAYYLRDLLQMPRVPEGADVSGREDRNQEAGVRGQGPGAAGSSSLTPDSCSLTPGSDPPGDTAAEVIDRHRADQLERALGRIGRTWEALRLFLELPAQLAIADLTIDQWQKAMAACEPKPRGRKAPPKEVARS